MFERFTGRAQKVVSLAHKAAHDGRESAVTTKHLLLGLLREGDGLAARALDGLGVVEADVLRRPGARAVEPQPEILKEPPAGQLPLTDNARRAMEYGLREALRLGHSYIGTEHLLLGLVHNESCIGSVILSEGWGLSRLTVVDAVLERLLGSRAAEAVPVEPAECVIRGYRIVPMGVTTIRIPAGAEFLCLSVRGGAPAMWWSVPVELSEEPNTWPVHEFFVIPTGSMSFDRNAVRYIGTFSLGGFDAHILESLRPTTK